MKCSVIPLGYLRANCSIVTDDDKTAVVADPGGDFSVLRSVIDNEDLRVEAILLTHGHEDHTGALAELKAYTGAKVYVGKDDAYRLPVEADVLLEDGDVIRAGGIELHVIATPGHTEGSVCYVVEDLMIAGDTLFRESVGRTDLPGGDTDALYASLSRLMKIEGDLTVVTGHGQITTLEYEREFNPFL